MRNKARRDLLRDLFFIIIGVMLAVVLAQFHVIGYLVDSSMSQLVSSFIAGIFFTSAFTIAPAAVALVSIHGVSSSTVALWGALGALCGDLLLFFFIRDRFAKDLIGSIKPSIAKDLFNTFHLGFLKWLSPLLGALIIASPLPDELGLTLLGLSKTRVIFLIPISFVMNYIGILSILWFGQVI